MTCYAAGHQWAINIFWLHFQGACMFSTKLLSAAHTERFIGVCLNPCVCLWFIQICSQLSERLEKQQAANRGELEKIRVNFTHTHASNTAVRTQTHAVD